jgi:hypothetical protein
MIQGKGMSIWRIEACEGGDANLIVQRAKAVGLKHVHIKTGDGMNPFNVQTKGALEKIVAGLRGEGIQVWGWHFTYGIQNGKNIAVQEAAVALKMIETYQLDGYALDFENTGNPKFSWTGGPEVARALMKKLREAGPDYPLGAKSHALMFKAGTDDRAMQPTIPFDAFIESMSVLIAQVYWVFDTPEKRLRESYRQYSKRYPGKLFAPYGAAYGEGQPNGKFWEASPAEITRFMEIAQELGFPAVAFYSWDYCSRKNPKLWEPIANFNWNFDAAPTAASAPAPAPAAPTPSSAPSLPPGEVMLASDIILELFEELNARNLDGVTALYNPSAALVTPQRTVQGQPNIRAYFNELLNQLPGGQFSLGSADDTSPTTTRYTWTASASNGKTVTDGGGNLGVLKGKIEYHSLNFTVK